MFILDHLKIQSNIWIRGDVNMKVLIYEQNANMQKRSGIGRALRHQKRALESNGIETTFDKKDTYDLVHINSSFKKSYKFMRQLQKKKKFCWKNWG